MKKFLSKTLNSIFVCFLFLQTAFSYHKSSTVLLVTPKSFKYNEETEFSNFFQRKSKTFLDYFAARKEFKKMISELKRNNINVLVLPSRKNKNTPDAVFPNNWFSVHKKNNTLLLYPMLTKNRQSERQPVNLIKMLNKKNIRIKKIVDLSHLEKKNMILEGTGSLVLDRKNNIAYSAISPRTNVKLVKKFCREMGYIPVLFHSYDENNNLIYHTNVMMSLGSKFAVIGLDSITDEKEKENVLFYLKKTNKDIVRIATRQLKFMVCNILEVTSVKNEKKVIISKRAYYELTDKQKSKIEKYSTLIPIDVRIIEKVGGGSARCMVAEIFY